MIALTRQISPRIAACELTRIEREPIDFARAVRQHHEYEQIITALGCTIQRLQPLPDHPDSVFVEDTAIVLPKVAIITRPGAASRRGEVDSVAAALGEFRSLEFIEHPGTLDGGDVLAIGSRICVGESTRTNADAIRQLASLTGHGYKVRPVKVSGCLHLKSAVTRVAEDAVLLNPEWVDASAFADMRTIEVHPDEPHGANALLIGTKVVYPAVFPRTRERLEDARIEVHTVEIDELQKAEGAVTCCSLLVSM
jgi:dimethylargininase